MGGLAVGGDPFVVCGDSPLGSLFAPVWAVFSGLGGDGGERSAETGDRRDGSSGAPVPAEDDLGDDWLASLLDVPPAPPLEGSGAKDFRPGR